MLVRRTAKELCAAFYEADRSERFRKFWPDIKQYIARNWPEFVDPARGVLASMLGRSDVSEHVKKEIYEALQEDHERQERYHGNQHDSGRFALKLEEPGKIEQKVRHELETL